MYLNNDPDQYSAPQYGMPAGCGGQNYPLSCPYFNSIANSDNDSDIKIIQYTIQPGDTLWDLANQYNSTVEEIIAANPGIDPDNLQVGQMILIPDPPFFGGWGGPWFGPWFRPWNPWFGPWGPWI